MQINPVAPLSAAISRSSATSLGSQWVGDFSGGGPGPLSKKEIAMISEVTGMDFNWPPRPNVDGYPELASRMANAHWEQMTSGAKLEEFTSAKMLADLHRSGVITDGELSKGLTFLESDESSTAINASRSTRQSGTVGTDGSIYL